MQIAARHFGGSALTHRERALRFLAEAIELSQALGLSDHDVDALKVRVYRRPSGEPSREMAQAAMCLGALAHNAGQDLDQLLAAEIDRFKAIPDDEHRRRHAAKVAEGIAET